MDSQKVVGSSFSRSMTTDIVVTATSHACETQQPKNGFILHTDLETQYTSGEFEKFVTS